jgi:hypothetical protein
MADETTPASALKSHDDVSGGPSAANNVSTSALDRSDSSWAKARIAELEAAISQLKLDKQEENDLWEKQRKEQQDQLVKRQADLEAREFEVCIRATQCFSYRAAVVSSPRSAAKFDSGKHDMLHNRTFFADD